MANRILLRRDTAVNWSNADPVLANGEIGLETDTERFKIGDGVSPWSERAYYANAAAIGAEYATLLEAKVTEAEAVVAGATDAVQDVVDQAQAKVVEAEQFSLNSANSATSSANSATMANTWRVEAADHAQDAQDALAVMTGTNDIAVKALLVDAGSETRWVLDNLYGGGGAEFIRVSYGSDPASGGVHTVGWHKAGETMAPSAPVYSDVEGNIVASPPSWLEVETGNGNFTFDPGTPDDGVYAVEMKLYIEDAWTNVYPVNTAWALGWSTSVYHSNGPQEFYIRQRTAVEDTICQAVAGYGLGAQTPSSMTLTKTIIDQVKVIQPWVYVPVDTSTERQFTFSANIVRLG